MLVVDAFIKKALIEMVV